MDLGLPYPLGHWHSLYKLNMFKVLNGNLAGSKAVIIFEFWKQCIPKGVSV